MATKRETDKRKKTENLKKPKKDPAILEDVDNNNDDEDLEQLMEGGKRKRKTPLVAKYAMGAGMGQYTTTSEDRKSRMLARQEKLERDLEEARKNAPLPPEEEEDEEDESQRQMESNLAKWKRQKKAEEHKRQREKVKTFSKDLNKGKWKPKTAVSVINAKKKKKMRKLSVADIQSPDKEEDKEALPEGFNLLEESVHCINIRQLDEFKAYLNQICCDFIQMVRQGRGVKEEYQKVVRRIYWVCKVVGNGSLISNADPECVAGSVKDLNCMAWRLKLTRKTEAILKELLVDEEEDAHVAKELTQIDEKEVYERIQKDIYKLIPEKQEELRYHVQGILHLNMIAHKHAADMAEHLSDASKLLSSPRIVTSVNATARPLVGIHLPIMNQFIEVAQKKHEEMVQQ